METSPLFPEEPEQTLSAPVSHASPTRAPGSDWARQMTAHSGRSLFELLPETGPLGSCLRTLLASSKWRSAACWLTWKAKGTKRRRLYFQLAPSTPRTGATGYGLLPTMRAALTNKGGLKLQSAVLLYPTPRASENENRQTKLTPSQMAGRRGLNLASVVNLFPTPTANRRDGLQSHGVNVIQGALNPEWVELLIGYPPGWANLDEAQVSGMETGSEACRESPPE